MGAAYNFALQAGARPGETMQHAFYCGQAASAAEVDSALEETEEIAWALLGNVHDRETLEAVADFAAYVVVRDGVLGFFQGVAETGPRALGHRSIIANPCNPKTLENINRLVKFREPIRPLAPLVTLEAAKKYFHLAPGAAEDNYNAYNYMVLTVAARPEAYAVVPAVIHKDGTARIQIVRPETDPFTHAFLKAMGRHSGAEVAVNTSLNVGSPIVQTPVQALAVLKRAKALTGLLMIASEGNACLAWHDVNEPPKDAGKQVLGWLEDWKESNATAAEAAGVYSANLRYKKILERVAHERQMRWAELTPSLSDQPQT
jgi:carbamoyltransferase